MKALSWYIIITRKNQIVTGLKALSVAKLMGFTPIDQLAWSIEAGGIKALLLKATRRLY